MGGGAKLQVLFPNKKYTFFQTGPAIEWGRIVLVAALEHLGEVVWEVPGR